MPETHRVQKLLSSRGYCSRRKAEKLIEEGRVKVNGKTISIGDKASEDDNIAVDGKTVPRQRKIYLMFNKPIGCVTALTDPKYRTIMDYISLKERVFPVGRLDYNTSGLLLLTNDGDFANKVMHPRYETKKTYLVGIDKPIRESEIKSIERGVELEDGKTSPAKIRKHTPKLLEISIHEGKNRVVRRIFNSLGFRVVSLERIKIGELFLGDLKRGKLKILSRKDIISLFRQQK